MFLGALLLSPPRQWLALVLAGGMGDILYNVFGPDPWPFWQIIQAHVGNSVSAVVGAWLVRTVIGERPSLSSVRELIGVVALGGVVSLPIAAGNGAMLLLSADPTSSFWENFTSWYASDLLGVTLVTPAVLAWQRGFRWSDRWKVSKRTLEFVTLLAAVFTVTSLAFYFQWLRQTETLSVAFPFVIWAALRFGLRGTTGIILIVAILAQTFTAFGFGPLGASALSPAQKSIELLVSLGVFAVVGLLPASVFAAFKTAEAREALRTRTMTLMATGAKLPAVLDSIVVGLEAENPDLVCSIHLVDRTGSKLSFVSGSSLPAQFLTATNEAMIRPDESPLGAAAFERQPVSVRRDSRDGRWKDWWETAARAGFNSCWSQPFMASAGHVLGTLTVYQRKPESPTRSEIELIASASQLAAVATERKQLEERFLRSQRMESIGTLAGGIAHDLNNMLTPIVIGAEILRESPLSDEDLHLVKNIEIGARRGANLVKQVLTFARGVEGARAGVDVGLIFTEVADIVATTFPKTIVFSRSIGEELPAVLGDATQIQQVLLNLCVNARDAMPNGGRLTLGGCKRMIDTLHASLHGNVVAGEFVEITVTDSGTGIRPEILPRIFEPFYTTKGVGQGTGLGLSTSLGIVRSHGGFIEFDTTVNVGSAFRVYLPVAAGMASTTTESAPPARVDRGEGELILLVDDEASIRTTTARGLENYGYRVVTAENGAHGLEQFARHQASVAAIVTDVLMPVMDGREFTAELRKRGVTVPIVTVSGFEGSPPKMTALNRHHLGKPYTVESLHALLADVLSEPNVDTRSNGTAATEGSDRE
jgi:signal transduction histidine kinase/integral membrane sensor domain MASE1/ActR/RegA family two-component response regulator